MGRVRVRRYQRADGTWVRAHTRGNPAAAASLGAVVVALIVLGFLLFGSPDTSTPITEPTLIAHEGFHFVAKARSSSLPCSAHAYGIVQEHLASHPCHALTRALYTASDPTGAIMLVAVSWAEMPTAAGAAELRTLVDGSGTGNIAELSRETPQFSSTKFTGRYYSSRIDGTVVTIGQAEPLSGAPPAEALLRSARASVTLPRA